MKQQRIDVYARFISDDSRPEDAARGGAAKARRAGARTARSGTASPKPGLKKHAALPK